MRSECFQAIQACSECLRYNIGKTCFHPIKHISARFPFDHCAMDLASFKTSPRGYNYAFLLVDVGTRFTIIRPLKGKFAKQIAWVLWTIICDFGVPKILQSDRGPEFVNQVIEALSDLMGVDHRLVAPYNPRANGLAESGVKLLKLCLKKMVAGNIINFDLFLPAVQMAINTRIVPLLKAMPAELFFARPHNPLQDYSSTESKLLSADDLKQRNKKVLEIIYPEIQLFADKVRSKRAAKIDKKRVVTKHIPVGAQVMLEDPRRQSGEPKWVGPYTVARRTRANTYMLLDSHHKLLGRNPPRSQLRLIAPTADVRDSKSEAFYVEDIIDHRRSNNRDEYLVKWHGYDSSHNTWEPVSSFEDRASIDRYWKRVSAPQ